MSVLSLTQIEESVRRLSLREQLVLMEWLAQTIRKQTLSEQEAPEDQLVAMANDPDIQRELAAIEAEFVGTEADGLVAF